MNLNLSMSSRKSRGELAAIFARLPAKNQPALLPALRAVVYFGVFCSVYAVRLLTTVRLFRSLTTPHAFSPA